MLAGSLAAAGYYAGEDLYPPRPSNPKGFFEAPEINAINEALMERMIPRRPRDPLGRLFRSRPTTNQLWLARVPVGATPRGCSSLRRRMEAQTARRPFCFKDPRFCYTLPAWRESLGDPAFLCIFREPDVTVSSILKECREMEYLRDLSINARRAYQVWILMYRHVLEVHRRQGDWLFLHFDQVLDGTAVPSIERLLGVRPAANFPEHALKRSAPTAEAPTEARRVYEELLKLSARQAP